MFPRRTLTTHLGLPSDLKRLGVLMLLIGILVAVGQLASVSAAAFYFQRSPGSAGDVNRASSALAASPGMTGMVFDPVNNRLLVVGYSDGMMTAFTDSGTSFTPVASVPVGVAPFGIGLVDHKAYVANWGTDLGPSSVSVIDAGNLQKIKDIPIDSVACGGQASHVAVNPITHRVYVALHAGVYQVAVIDSTADTLLTCIKTNTGAFGIAVHPASNSVYVGSRDGLDLWRIDGATNQAARVVEWRTPQGGGSPYYVTVSLATNRLYAMVGTPDSNVPDKLFAYTIDGAGNLSGVPGSPAAVGNTDDGGFVLESQCPGHTIYIAATSEGNVWARNSDLSFKSIMGVGANPFGLAENLTLGYLYVGGKSARAINRLYACEPMPLTPTATVPLPSATPPPEYAPSLPSPLPPPQYAPPLASPTPSTCKCPAHGTDSAPDASLSSPAGYKLVSYSCNANYAPADYWPPNLYDVDDKGDPTNLYNIEGSDETAVNIVSSDTQLIYTGSSYQMCRITQVWRYQPVGATPAPHMTVTPIGEFNQVWQMPSIQHRGETIAQSLGVATGLEKAVWMSEASIDNPLPPAPLQYHDHLFRVLGSDQVYLLHAINLSGERLWESAPGIPRQAGEKNFLGAIQYFQALVQCGNRKECAQHGLMIWAPIWRPLYNGSYVSDNTVNVLAGDGYGESFDSSLGWIAYECPGPGENLDICVVKSDGSVQTDLTNHPKGDWSGRWAPDGSQLAFSSERDGGNEIYLLRADGVQRLTFSPEIDTAPAWSPDGKRIAFVSMRDKNYEIYVMNSDGSGQTNLTHDASDDSSPAWSPNGQHIAFASYRDGQQRIYVMNPDGTGVTRLSDGRGEYAPTWSPDGQRILFVSLRDGNYEIYVMNADGSNPVRLTSNSEPDSGPVWSPDGKQIAYCHYTAGVYHLYLMNADGSNQHMLGQGFVGCPTSWH